MNHSLSPFIAVLLCAVATHPPVPARAGTLSVTNGDFANLASNSVTGGGWYGGVPAGWTTTAASNPYSVLESGGIYYANMQTLAPNSNAALRQNVGTIDVTSDITLTFTRTLLGGGSILESGIFNLADGNAFATNNSGTISSADTVSYTAKGVAPGTALYIAFWAAAGAPGITGISILDSATTYLWNGGVSGVWTNGGGGWTDKFDNTATNYDNAKPVVVQFTNAAAGTNVTVAADGVNVGNIVVDGGNYAFSGGTITLTNTTWSVSNAVATVSGTLAGTTGLTKSGGGTLVLSASNSYSGGTTVNAGRLVVNGTLSAEGGALTIDGSGGAEVFLDLGSQQTRTGTITMTGQNARLVSSAGTGSLVSNGGDLQFGGGLISASISGTGGFNVTGGGSLNSSNSFTGATTISATPGWYGTSNLFVVNAHALGAASGDLTISGGTVDLQNNTITRSGNVTISGGTINAGTLSKDGGSFSIQGGSINAVLAGTAGLVKSGAGTATLGASNSYAAATDLQAGTLSLSGAGRLGGAAVTISNGATLAMATTGINVLSNSISGAGAIVADSGDTRITGAVTTTGGLTINAGTVRIGNSSTAGSYSGNTVVASGAVLAFSRTDAYTHTGAISGAGAVTKVDAGAVTLTASNSYSGVTTLFAGALVAGHASALGSGNISFSSGGGNTGTIRYTAASAVTDWGTRFKSSSGTIRLDTDGHNVTLAGAIDSSNTQGLAKSGSGSLTLGGSNTFTGPLTVSAGVLDLSATTGAAAGAVSSVSVATNAILLLSQNNQVSNTAAVTLSGGTIRRGGNVSEVFGGLTVNQDSFLDFGADNATGTLTFDGAYTASALLTVQSFLPGNKLQFAAGFDANLLPTGGNLSNGNFAFSNGFTTGTEEGFFTITAIPEPSTYVAALGLLGVMLWPARRFFVVGSSPQSSPAAR